MTKAQRSRCFRSLIVLVASLNLHIATTEAQVQVRIDVRDKFQQLDGFGASGAWWHTWVGNYPQAKQEHLLDLLFDETQGIGLSIFRYNIPAGSDEQSVERPERRTPSIETVPGEYDLSADEKALNFLSGARARGVKHFVLFSNSPPPRMTNSGMASGGPEGGSNLRPDAVEAFATYLLDVSELIRERYDLAEVSLSPINEPQWEWGKDWRGQEGCHYKPAEVAAVIRAVIEKNLDRDLGFEIEAPESGAWKGTLPYAQALFADPLINQHVEELAIHSYWTSPDDRREAVRELRAEFPEKRLAMTEYCEMRHGHDLSIEGGLHMAEVIHEDLTVAGVVSWQWWLGVAAGGYRDGLIYAHPETQKIEPTKRLWVLGQWSRFVRPGAVRVHVDAGDSELKPTAFLSPDGARLVVVVINPTDDAQTMRLRHPQFRMAQRRIFVTDKDRDLAEVDNNGNRIALPAKSVCTVVLESR